MTISSAAQQRRATMLRPVRVRGGWHDFKCGSRASTAKCGKKRNAAPTRPDFLPLPEPARIVERTNTGYCATVTDEEGCRTAVGVFATAAEAIAAARVAYEHALDAAAGLEVE